MVRDLLVMVEASPEGGKVTSVGDLLEVEKACQEVARASLEVVKAMLTED